MKGRSSFTASEIDQIRELIRRKTRANKSVQKNLRAQMRDLGFYISDFEMSGHGFNEADLDRLIRNGRITVVDAGRGGQERRESWWRRLWRWIRHS